MVRTTCQPNVTEIGDWLRPYEPYGPKRQTFLVGAVLVTAVSSQGDNANIRETDLISSI